MEFVTGAGGVFHGAATSAGPTATPGIYVRSPAMEPLPQQPQIPNPNPNLKTMSSAASTTTPPVAAHDPPVRSSPWLQPRSSPSPRSSPQSKESRVRRYGVAVHAH
jgi:hypothetical protein